MPGRSLDTAGLCVTSPVYTEIPHYHWASGGTLSSAGGGGATAYGGATKTNQSNGGIELTGSTGGFTHTISGITSPYISLQLNFSFLSGASTVTIYSGSTAGGTPLASASINYTSPAASIYFPAGGSTSSPATVTVQVGVPTTTGSNPRRLIIDSIGYQWITLTLGTTLYTQCGSPKDKYEFGFNGQMKSNEIAGVGNHNTAQFWEYDTRLGRRWNLDPKPQVSLSDYSVFRNSPIRLSDIKGDEVNMPSLAAKKFHDRKYNETKTVKKRGKEVTIKNDERDLEYVKLYDKLNNDHDVLFVIGDPWQGKANHGTLRQMTNNTKGQYVFNVEWGKPFDANGGDEVTILMEELFHAKQMLESAEWQAKQGVHKYTIRDEVDAKVWAAQRTIGVIQYSFSIGDGWNRPTTSAIMLDAAPYNLGVDKHKYLKEKTILTMWKEIVSASGQKSLQTQEYSHEATYEIEP